MSIMFILNWVVKKMILKTLNQLLTKHIIFIILLITMEKWIILNLKIMKTKKKNFINMRLLWEYEPQNFDVEKNCGIIVQRVIERGLKKDFVAIENQYGRNKRRGVSTSCWRN